VFSGHGNFPSAGAWSLLENEDEDINVVCKSSYEDYLAVGDNQGSIRIFKYPASTHRVSERKLPLRLTQ